MPVNHSKQWKSLTLRARKWIEKSSGDIPSFVVLYLKPSRGRQQIVWEGPPHMQKFAIDDLIQEKFMETVIGRPLHPSVKKQLRSCGDETETHPLKVNPMKLPSLDVGMYRCNDLQRIVPLISNPYRKKNFWNDPDNRPKWWPDKAKRLKKKKRVPFRSPNHPASGSKLSVVQLRRILREFLKDCKGHYTIVQPGAVQPTAECETVLPASSSDSEESDMESNNLSDDGDDLQLDSDDDMGRDDKWTLTTAEHALNDLQAAKANGWEAFCIKCAQVNVDMSPLEDLEVKCSRDIPQSYMDSRIYRSRTSLTKRIPTGYHLGKSTGDGNCLYCSVSIALKGDESVSSLLRLASIVHGVKHIQHYIKMYKVHMEDAGMALQFVATVSGASTFECRPTNEPSVDDLLWHVFKEEIMSTSVLNSYSGPLQVQFLAGHLQRPIKQVTEDHSSAHAIYQMEVLPCTCTLGDSWENVVCVMWMRMKEPEMGERTPPMNHIAPLIPGSMRVLQASAPESQHKKPLQEIIGDVCIMAKIQKCSVSQATTGEIDWIMCQRCHAWYHSICIGISSLCLNSKCFVCCYSQEQLRSEGGELAATFILKHPPKQSHGSNIALMFTDIQSLYPGKGISDGIIDFYRMTMLNNSNTSTVHFISALTFNAIVDSRRLHSENTESREQAYRALHRTLCKGVDLSKVELLGFPCKLTESWHWVLVLVKTQTQEALVFDSLGRQVDYYVQYIGDFLQSILSLSKSLNLKTKFVPVARQVNGYDCGIHVIHNMSIIVNKFSPDDPEFTKPPDTISIRAAILAECYRKSTAYFETTATGKGATSGRPTRTKAPTDHDEKLKRSILNNVEDGLKAVEIEDKGRAVVATRGFKKGDFLCEYKGNLMTYANAIQKEAEYSKEVDGSTSCFMYYFKWKEMIMCVDATEESGHLGRLINHGLNGNAKAKLLTIKDTPHMYFVATQAIPEGQEILYDYGDRRNQGLSLAGQVANNFKIILTQERSLYTHFFVPYMWYLSYKRLSMTK